MGCDPAYAAVTPPGGNLDPARHFRGALRLLRSSRFALTQPDAFVGAGAFPLREAVAATASAGMLRLEHRVSAHRRLLPVVRRICGRETRSDEVLAVRADSLQTLADSD